MKKIVKISAIVIASLLIILTITPLAFRGKINDIIKKEAAKSLNATLDFKSLNISLIRHFPKASIELNGLVIAGINQFESDTLASVGKVSVVVNVASLFSDSGFEVSKLFIDTPNIKAIKLADGTANWDIVRETEADTVSTAEEEPSSFKINIKDLRINDGVVAFIDDSSKMQAMAGDINLRLTGDLSAQQSDIRLKIAANGIYFIMNKIPFLSNARTEADITVSADLANNKYTLSDNKIKLNAITLGFDGWVALVGDAIDMDIKANSSEVDFKEVLSLIPAVYANDFKDLTATGTFSIDAWVKGRMEGDNLPAFNVGLAVADGVVKYVSLPKSIDGINISATASSPGGVADKTVVDVSKLAFTIAGNPFTATMHAETPVSDLNFSATANGKLDLGMIKDVYPLGDSIKLSGVLTANIKAAGKMSDIEKERYENVKGEGNFNIEKMTVAITGMPEVVITKAAATITPAAMALNTLTMNIGKSDITASGEVSNYLPYVLKDGVLSGKMSVNSSLLDLNEIMGPEEETTPADTAAVPMSVVEVPKNLNLKLDASLKKILFQKMTISDLEGGIVVAKGAVNMDKLSMKALGGTVKASGSYSTAENPAAPSLMMMLNFADASFSQTFKELDMIQKMAPIFEKTGGNYSMSMDMNTLLDMDMMPQLNTLEAKGLISSSNIHIQNLKAFEMLASVLKDDRLKNIEAKDVKIPFTVSDGLVSTAPFDIKMGDVSVNMSGNTGLDQTIDYNAKISLPSSLTRGLVSNVNAHIGGTFTDPKVNVNLMEAVGDALKNVIGKELLNKVGDLDVNAEIEKQAARLRDEANKAAEKTVQLAKDQAQKLVDQTSNPLAKVAAQIAADKAVKEAEKQAQKIRDEAEKQIEALKTKSLSQTPAAKTED